MKKIFYFLISTFAFTTMHSQHACAKIKAKSFTSTYAKTAVLPIGYVPPENKYDLIDKLFNKALQTQFQWAMEIDAEYRF